MKKSDISHLLQLVSIDDLTNLIPVKKKLDALRKKRKDLDRKLAGVDKQIQAIESSLGKTISLRPGKTDSGKGKTRIDQPSLASVTLEIMKEKKGPLTVNDIHDALLNEKKYQTQAKNFKGNLRVLLYKNDKGLFRKVGPGEFGLKASTEKIEAPAKKKAPASKAIIKKKSVQKTAPKIIVQPSLPSLIVEILKEKKKPLSLYEIVGSLLNEKKYQSSSGNFDELVRKRLYANPSGFWMKMGPGKFGLK